MFRGFQAIFVNWGNNRHNRGFLLFFIIGAVHYSQKTVDYF